MGVEGNGEEGEGSSEVKVCNVHGTLHYVMAKWCVDHHHVAEPVMVLPQGIVERKGFSGVKEDAMC